MIAAQKKPEDGGKQVSGSLYITTYNMLHDMRAMYRIKTGKNITLMELTDQAVKEYFEKNYKDK